MAWTIDYSLIEDWFDKQDVQTLKHVKAALDMLREQGPNLGRPLVDRIKGSKIHNLKELRIVTEGRGEYRILFVFDPDRRAILLVAGDKSKGKNNSLIWFGWYRRAISLAERRYAEYLKGRSA